MNTPTAAIPASSQSSDRVRLGQYILGETVGIGSFGKVKLAEHATTGQKVALKIINRRKMADLEMVNRIKREIQYLKVLRHPHIIKLYEVLTTPTEIIMVMEYAGDELFNLIVTSGRMTENDARRLFQQMIAAVEFCHRHKIVHRDLKPENVLLDSYKNVKIADFGLSNIMTDGDFLKTSCGSPNYAAPEVISGKLYAGPEVDVWSCGVILYVMLCGKLPFDEDYIPALFRKINEGDFTIPSHVSEQARSLISSMLVVDPVKRATIADIRQNPWFSQNLPDYLKPLPNIDDSIFQNIDSDTVADLSRRLRIPADTIVNTLQQSPETASLEISAGLVDRNAIRVAYQLLYDQRRYMRMNSNSIPPILRQLSNSDQQQQPPSPAINQFVDVGGNNTSTDLSDSISILSSSLSAFSAQSSLGGTQGNLALTSSSVGGHNVHIIPASSSSASLNPLTSSMTSTSAGTATVPTITNPSAAKKVRARWHLGIRSKSSPKEILREIYHALKSIGVEWKPAISIADNSLPVGGAGGSLNPSNGASSSGEKGGAYRIPSRLVMKDVGTIYFEWMLFKMPDSGSSPAMNYQNGSHGNVSSNTSGQMAGEQYGDYLVDFKQEGWKPNGSERILPVCLKSSVLFLEMCAQLIIELAIN